MHVFETNDYKVRIQSKLLVIITLGVILFCGSAELTAQPQFILKRTRAVNRPIFVQLIAGYNGVSDPAEMIQDRIRNFDDNTYGGLMAGIQAGFTIDTVFSRVFWGGGEFYYHRYVNRYLETEWPDVHYVGEPNSRVDYIEELHAIGFQLFIAYDVLKPLQIQLGGGVQYLYPIVNVPADVVGLFESQVFPTATAALRYTMLSYDHGSIDVNIRAMQGFGDYGSFEVQSLLGFNFRF